MRKKPRPVVIRARLFLLKGGEKQLKKETFLSLGILTGIWWSLPGLLKLPKYILPTPLDVIRVFISDYRILWEHTHTTLKEAGLGLAISFLLGICVAIMMNRSRALRNSIYPILVLSQSIPIVAIAPLITIWLGLGTTSKLVVVILVCFFPIAVNSYEGFKSIDRDYIDVMLVMKATRYQIYRYVIIPSTLPQILSGLKISASYAVIGAVIAEWLGGEKGLGIYMIRVMSTYDTDKLFAAIVVVVFFSLIFFKLIDMGESIFLPWIKLKTKEEV